jgi:hypothetical protein
LVVIYKTSGRRQPTSQQVNDPFSHPSNWNQEGYFESDDFPSEFYQLDNNSFVEFFEKLLMVKLRFFCAVRHLGNFSGARLKLFRFL